MNVVWSCSGMALFARDAGKALGWPVFIDAPVGDCDTVLIMGMFDPPFYAGTLEATARAKRRIIQWCGTDAKMIARPELLPEAIHTASFDIYRDRVRAKGIECATVMLPTKHQFKAMPLPAEKVVTTYFGNNAMKYGANLVTALAACLPDVKFRSVAMGSLDEAGMRDCIANTTVSLQPANTGGGATTREMMAAGRVSLSTIPMKHSVLVDEDNFLGLLRAVQEALEGTADSQQAVYWQEQNSPEVFAAKVRALLE